MGQPKFMGIRGRNCIITSFDPAGVRATDWDRVMRELRCHYVIAGLEQCPSTGRWHYHLYMEFNRPWLFTRLRQVLPFTVNDIEPRFGSVKEMVAYIKKGAAGGTRGRSVSKDTIQTLMNCMMKLEMGPHLQRSSNTTSEPTSDTTKVSKSSWMSSVENKIENQKGLSWRPSSTSASLGLESPIDATTTRTTENPDTSSRRKLPAKFSLTGTMGNEPSGSTSSVGQPYRFHCSCGSLTSGTTGSRLKEAQCLFLDLGRFSSLPQHILLSGGQTVLSIWRTTNNSGEDLPRYSIYLESRGTTATPFLLNDQRDSMTESPQRLTQRQPQMWNEENENEEDSPFWSLHGPSEKEEQMSMPEPVSLSDLPNPWGDMSPIDLEQTSLDCTMSTDSDSEENVQPRDVGTTTYT